MSDAPPHKPMFTVSKPRDMCPVLIKQGRDAATTMNQSDPNVKNALTKLDRAAALHKEGKHVDSMREANEALTLLGVKK